MCGPVTWVHSIHKLETVERYGEGKRKKYDIDRCGRLAVRNEKTEGGEERRSCRSFGSAKAVTPHHVNMEISEAWAAGKRSSISFRFSALCGRVSYTACPRTAHTNKQSL